MVIDEVWKPIKGYEGSYEVSNFGNVRSIDRIVIQRHWLGGSAVHAYKKKLIKTQVQRNGYVHVDLHKCGALKRFLVHRLVAEHFLSKPKGKEYINHIDSNPQNNSVENLEWCTQSENIQYAYDSGRKIPPHRKAVLQIDSSGSVVRVFDSQATAERETGIKQANISKVCRGERSHAGGFMWKYAN